MRRLVAVDTRAGASVVDTMLRVWDAGDAILPIDHRVPEAARRRLLQALRPALFVDADGARHHLDDAVPTLEGDALVIPTSGSTGTPKGVIHTHRSVAASARATNEGVGTDPEHDRWLCCLPLSHVAGLSVVTRALISGSSLHVLNGFDADAVTAAAMAGATLTTLVPTALARIDPRLFRRIVVGGTHPPEHLPPNCLVSYGLTETGSAIAYDGRALRGVELRLVADDGREIHPESPAVGGAPAPGVAIGTGGARGEIFVRGEMVLRAYRTDEPEGRDPRTDGWLATNDAGSWAPDGRLTVHGRTGDMIITGGENVWPVEVERVLATLPAIAEVAVIGRPDPEWGQRVVAVVVPTDTAEPPTLDTIRSHCKAELPSFAAPRSIDVVDELPRTSLGKVTRHAL